MNEETEALRAQVTMLTCLVVAIMRNHPDPDALIGPYLSASEQVLAEAGASTRSDKEIAAMEGWKTQYELLLRQAGAWLRSPQQKSDT